MPSYNGISAALAAVQKKLQKSINAALVDDVANAVKVKEIEHTVSDVYSRQTSGAYQRRYADGGLLDVENLNERLDGDGVLVVSNDTPFNPFLDGVSERNGVSENSGNGLAGLVAYGNGWEGHSYDYSNPGATDFINKTKEDLAASGEHVKALKSGLIKRGFYVK